MIPLEGVCLHFWLYFQEITTAIVTHNDIIKTTSFFGTYRLVYAPQRKVTFRALRDKNEYKEQYEGSFRVPRHDIMFCGNVSLSLSESNRSVLENISTEPPHL